MWRLLGMSPVPTDTLGGYSLLAMLALASIPTLVGVESEARQRLQQPAQQRNILGMLLRLCAAIVYLRADASGEGILKSGKLVKLAGQGSE